MFTGIIDHCGQVAAIENKNGASLLWIESQFEDLKLGESIAVDGVCFSVMDQKPEQFCCQLSPETKRITIANHYNVGSIVNLERALMLSDRLGGHFLSGHVDQLLKVHETRLIGEFMEVVFTDINKPHHSFVLKKGSIALNGVSLTVNEVQEDIISVMLIPHTLSHTNLKHLRQGDSVNVEFDWLAKIIVKQIQLGVITHEK